MFGVVCDSLEIVLALIVLSMMYPSFIFPHLAWQWHSVFVMTAAYRMIDLIFWDPFEVAPIIVSSNSLSDWEIASTIGRMFCRNCEGSSIDSRMDFWEQRWSMWYHQMKSQEETNLLLPNLLQFSPPFHILLVGWKYFLRPLFLFSWISILLLNPLRLGSFLEIQESIETAKCYDTEQREGEREMRKKCHLPW